MSRKKLPARRETTNFSFEHTYPGADPRTFTASVGYYPDGKVAEVFVHLVDGKAMLVTVDTHDSAIAINFALQHGADPKAMGKSMLRDEDGTPQGFLGSLLDALTAQSQTPL